MLISTACALLRVELPGGAGSFELKKVQSVFLPLQLILPSFYWPSCILHSSLEVEDLLFWFKAMTQYSTVQFSSASLETL
jgi:hypothetical protein